MKLELSIAADGALVARPPHPMSRAFPASSRLVTPSTPLRETGSWAPTRAQATPSSSMCFAHSRTDAGMSSSVVLASQVASRPVGPFGSVAARARLPATSASTGLRVIVMSNYQLTGISFDSPFPCLVRQSGLARQGFSRPHYALFRGTARSDERFTILVDELLDRHRRAATDFSYIVVRAGKDAVAVVDGDFMKTLHQE